MIWTKEKPMSKAFVIREHITRASIPLRIYVKQSKFKRKVNKVLSYVGMRWL